MTFEPFKKYSALKDPGKVTVSSNFNTPEFKKIFINLYIERLKKQIKDILEPDLNAPLREMIRDK